MKPLLPLLTAAILAFTPHQGFAGCGHFFHRPHVQQVVAVPVVQNYFHAVGESTLIQALVEKELAKREALKAPAQAAPQVAPAAVTGSLLQAKCAKCHQGDSSLTNADGTLDCSKFRRFAEIFGQKKDVPAAMKAVVSGTTPEDMGKLMDELLAIPAANEPGRLE